MIVVDDLIPELFNLEESKAIGTLDQKLSARELALSIQRLPRRVQARRKKALATASKLQKSLANQMYNELLALAEDYLDEESFVTMKRLKF